MLILPRLLVTATGALAPMCSSALCGGRILLRLLVRAFVPTGPVVIGIDGTIERRRGAKSAAQGVDRDPVRPSHTHFVNASGLRWVSLMLLALSHGPCGSGGALPDGPVALGALLSATRPCPSRILFNRARQAVRLVRRRLPEREIVVVGDRTYAALEWLNAARTPCVSSPACGSMRRSMSMPCHVNLERVLHVG